MSKIRNTSSNRGTKTNFSTGGSWAHNCPVTPFAVIIQPKGTKFFSYILTVDATNITMDHDGLGGVDFEWVALYLE